jgi:hypothetical protein
VKVTAHHKGHYEFSVCDQVITSALSNPQACLDKHILERATANEAGVTDCALGDRRAACQPVDPRHKERFYLPPPGFSETGANTHKFYFKLPSGLVCAACTMQWRWWSANSCIPGADYACFKHDLESNGFSASNWGLGRSCPGGGGGCNGEEFRNCIDISIAASDGGTHFPSSGPTSGSTPVPTNVPTIPRMLEPSSFPTAIPSMRLPTSAPTESAPACTVTEAGSAQLATDNKCQAACRLLPQGLWPCGGGSHPCVCDTALPTPHPSRVPTPMPTPYPSPRQPTPMPTPYPSPVLTPMPTPYPSPVPTLQPDTPLPTSTPPTSDCVDYAGNLCHACLASNNVCYTESHEWCDTWSQYRWCGVSRRLLSVAISDTVML